VSDLALDADGDLLIEHGDAVLATGPRATVQDWQRRVGLFKGEWKRDRRVGIDYQNVIFDGRPSRALLQHIFETVTRQTPGIASLKRLEFRLDRTTRVLEVLADATHDDGTPLELVFTDVLLGDLTASAASEAGA